MFIRRVFFFFIQFLLMNIFSSSINFRAQLSTNTHQLSCWKYRLLTFQKYKFPANMDSLLKRY